MKGMLRAHPLPSFNINELGFSQSSCLLLGFFRGKQQGDVEHMQTLLGLLKGRLTEATDRDFYFSRGFEKIIISLTMFNMGSYCMYT